MNPYGLFVSRLFPPLSAIGIAGKPKFLSEPGAYKFWTVNGVSLSECGTTTFPFVEFNGISTLQMRILS